MGPIWGRQDPSGPHVGPMNFAIWGSFIYRQPIFKWDAVTWQGSFMMTSSNGSIFRVTGHLCGEFTRQRWIPLTKASDAALWCFILVLAWINGSVNNGEAGILRRHRTHYDVTVMMPAKQHMSHYYNNAEATGFPNQVVLRWYKYVKYNYLEINYWLIKKEHIGMTSQDT